MSSTRAAAMDATLAQLREAIDWLDGQWAVAPEAVEETVRLARIAYDALAGDVRGYVLGDGGPHGSPDAAWRAWEALALDTASLIMRADAYGKRADLSALVRRVLESAGEAGRNVVVGAGALSASAALVALAVAALLVVRDR